MLGDRVGETVQSKVSMTAEDDRDVGEGSGITIEVLQQHFHQPLVTVAEELGVSLTVRAKPTHVKRKNDDSSMFLSIV